jgi:hypothetical protein
VAIFVAPPPIDANGENSDDLLSLFPSYHDYLPSDRVAASAHGHKSTMDREPDVVPWSIDLIYDFFYKKQFQEISENEKIIGKPLDFLINLETTPTFFKLVLELYHNQFSF